MPDAPFPLDPRTTTLVREDEPLVIRARKIRAEVVAGPQAGQVTERPGPEVRIGSAAGCDIVLLDPTVSRHHLTLRVDSTGIRVVDAGSRNGTRLDGVRVVEAWARADSVIEVGNSVLRLCLLEDMVELPLSAREAFGALIGRSVAMRRVFSVLERVAPTDDTVLVEGETGTGKELAAEAIHEESPRAAGPFVVLDCSAVAANLVESELFGHVRGAFTGAVADRLGAFEAADGGTIFLDEVGELPIELQPKLLRAIERLEVRRVGSNAVRRVDVRFVAATNRPLEDAVARGRFREDLYYRLAVLRVAMPPLRERADDIPLLVEHFTRQLSHRGRPLAQVPDEVVRGFQAQAWAGNVRELRNAVARVLSLGRPAGPEADRLPRPTAPPPGVVDLSVPLRVARDRLADEFERTYLLEALRQSGGNITRAAEIAGVHRKFVQRAIRRHGLRGDET